MEDFFEIGKEYSVDTKNLNFYTKECFEKPDDYKDTKQQILTVNSFLILDKKRYIFRNYREYHLLLVLIEEKILSLYVEEELTNYFKVIC